MLLFDNCVFKHVRFESNKQKKNWKKVICGSEQKTTYKVIQKKVTIQQMTEKQNINAIKLNPSCTTHCIIIIYYFEVKIFYECQLNDLKEKWKQKKTSIEI